MRRRQASGSGARRASAACLLRPTSISTARVGAAPRRHAAHARRSRPRRAAGHQRAGVARRSRDDLPAALAAAESARRRDADAAHGHRHVPRQPAAPDAVRHRHRRQRGGGQEHVRPHPARAAARWPAHPRVDLVTTDGFLLPNRVLEARGLLERKGFPESYDVRGSSSSWPTSRPPTAPCTRRSTRTRPTTSSPAKFQVVDRPDIVIVEGLNVLQTGEAGAAAMAARDRHGRGSSCRTSSISRSTSTPTRRTSSAGTSRAS